MAIIHAGEHMKEIYNDSFYRDRDAATAEAARIILSHIFSIISPIESCLDLGCGVGTWLRVARELGVKSIQGFDGEWVPEQYLQIPKDCFTRVDLTYAFPEQYVTNLAICLEMAEHLPEKSANQLTDFLTDSADYILFSAAPPGQPGGGHINGQWPEYWANKFSLKGFVALDLIRRHIWREKGIPFWYKQNIFLCVKNELVSGLRLPQNLPSLLFPISIVHPELFNMYCGKMRNKQSRWIRFRESVKLVLRQAHD
jgi:hypothetical protein